MSTDCNKHSHHDHEHSPECGHTRIKHDDHTDYVHDGTYTINTGNTGMNVKFLSVTKTLMNVIQLILTVTILKTVSMNKCHTVITPITLLTVACTTNMVTTSMTTDRLTSLKTNLQLG